MKRKQILLDMDGVLADFLSGAIEALNRDFNRSITIDQYAREFGRWETYDYYGITIKEFWESIHKTPDFWYNLSPLPWCGQMYSVLQELGEVTIVTSPSEDPDCSAQKQRWLNRHLSVKPDAVFIGSRKHLMAGNGILIDDYYKNVGLFQLAGGKAILIPSNWNTPDLKWERVWNTILTGLQNGI
jgi:5'(3')-deoxyribonucleotidase